MGRVRTITAENLVPGMIVRLDESEYHTVANVWEDGELIGLQLSDGSIGTTEPDAKFWIVS